MRRPTLALLLLALAACAGNSAAPRAPRAPRAQRAPHIQPPTMLGATHPEGIRGEIRADIRVLVDSTGAPDVNTLRVVGALTSDDRAAIERWITEARFRPAQQGGQPVAAEYHMSIRTEVRAVRVR